MKVIVCESGGEWKRRRNVHEIQVMVSQERPSECEVRLDDELLETVQSFKYIMSVLTEEGGIDVKVSS